MLDIPPPPPLSRPGSPADAGPEIDDIMVVPSSDEEYSQVGGGWRLVGKDSRKVSRQQTMIQRGGGLTRLSPYTYVPGILTTQSAADTPDRRTHGVLQEGNLTPVSEQSPARVEDQGKVGVTRSRTLPGVRIAVAESNTNTERARVLRKQKRASSSQPNRSGTPGPTSNG
jgi:hypothetical protein